MKKLNTNLICVAGSVCVTLAFFIFNMYTPFIADDYSSSLGIYSITDIVNAQVKMYFEWGGRSIGQFLCQFWLLTGKLFFNVTNTIVYCTFIFLVQFHITGNKKPAPWLFLLLNAFFWVFVPAWGQNFLWVSGSCIYLWPTTIMLFFLVPFRKRQADPAYRLNVPLSILFFPLGILAGWGIENSSAAVLFLFLAYFTVKVFRKDKFALFEILGAIGFCVGFFLLLASPGIHARLGVVNAWDKLDSGFPFLLRLIVQFIDSTDVFVRNHGLLLLFIAVLLGFDFVYHQKRKLFLFSYFYALAALASVYSMVFSPMFPDRTFLICIVFIAITLGNILTQINFKLPGIVEKHAGAVISVVLIVLSVSFLTATKDIMEIYLRWYDRIEYILAEKEKGNLEIEVRLIDSIDNHAALYGLSDLKQDKNDWPNTAVAAYFGLQSIKANPEFDIPKITGTKIKRMIFPPGKLINLMRNRSTQYALPVRFTDPPKTLREPFAGTVPVL